MATCEYLGVYFYVFFYSGFLVHKKLHKNEAEMTF